MAAPFADRLDAGERLAVRLAHLTGRPVRVLALPRGGVLVAAPIAERLRVPLDVAVVRKIGAPGHAELAMGALAICGPHTAVVRNEHVISAARVTDAAFDHAARRERVEAERRVAEWGRSDLDVAGTDVVLVDDGLATGATMRAAISAVRRAGAARVIAAVPVGAPPELAELANEADEVVYIAAPRQFLAVGVHYVDFGQVDDETVMRTLVAARPRSS